MCTIYTHAVVGLGLARLYAKGRMPWLYWGLAALLPVLPDLDTLSLAAYGSPWGHRGVTHSLAFALWVGALAASLTFRYFQVSFWSLSALCFALIASHGLLDALTRGGMPIPFFWPLEGRQGNWGPIPVADLGFALPDPRRSRALRAELFWVWVPTAVVVIAATASRSWRRAQAPVSAPGFPGSKPGAEELRPP
jgi:inner membrane protein